MLGTSLLLNSQGACPNLMLSVLALFIRHIMNDAVVRLREDGVWGCEVEGCGWAKTVCRTQAFKHAKTKHPGCRPHALSKKAKPYRPRGQSEEEKKEAKRCYSRAYRAARKAQGAQEAQGETQTHVD